MMNLTLQELPPVEFQHGGFTFTLRAAPSMTDYSMRQVEATVANGGKPDEYAKLEKSARAKVVAYAMIGTMVIDMKPVRVNGFDITFDGASDKDEFVTQCEELLALNGDLRDAVYMKAIGLQSRAPNYPGVEEIAGNSSTPSVSTDELAKSPDVVV